MTSKEKLAKKNLELAKQLGIDLTPQPSKFEQCIKEWEERGWKVTIDNREIEIEDTKTLSSISIDRKDKEYWCSHYLSFELHYLLSKTLKALEEMKDEQV